MGQIFSIHPDNPQQRLIKDVADIVRRGGVIVYPTDSTYALACHLNDKNALERIRRIRRLDEKHHLTLICRDLSELGTYASVDNRQFRLLKRYTPGAFTFLLQATKEVPRRLMHPKKKTVGLRVPENKIAHALLAELDEPMMTTTLLLPGDDYPITEVHDIPDHLLHELDAIIDGGACGLEETTVIDLTTDDAQILRQGKGEFFD